MMALKNILFHKCSSLSIIVWFVFHIFFLFGSKPPCTLSRIAFGERTGPVTLMTNALVQT